MTVKIIYSSTAYLVAVGKISYVRLGNKDEADWFILKTDASQPIPQEKRQKLEQEFQSARRGLDMTWGEEIELSGDRPDYLDPEDIFMAQFGEYGWYIRGERMTQWPIEWGSITKIRLLADHLVYQKK